MQRGVLRGVNAALRWSQAQEFTLEYKHCLCPNLSPYGRVLSRKKVDEGLWGFTTDIAEGFCLSKQRAEIVIEKFGACPPHKLNETPRWWRDDGYAQIVVAAFYDELANVTDKTCYYCYHEILSAAQWDKDLANVALKLQNTGFHMVVKSYAARNHLYYMQSSLIEVQQDCFGKYHVMRLVRKSDGHAITARMPEELLASTKYFTEAEASMFLMVPESAKNR